MYVGPEDAVADKYLTMELSLEEVRKDKTDREVV